MQVTLTLEERYSIHQHFLTEDNLDLVWEEATEENLNKLGVPQTVKFEDLESVTYYDFDKNMFYAVKLLNTPKGSTYLKVYVRHIKVTGEFTQLINNK